MEEIAENLSDFDDIDASSECSVDNDGNENYASAPNSDTEELVDEDLAWEMTTHPPNWSCDNLQDFHVRDFNGPQPRVCLPQHFDVSTAWPIDYFSLYFSDEVLESFVCNTNAYAKWMIHKNMNKSLIMLTNCGVWMGQIKSFLVWTQ